jgi:hypothetical protein
MTHKLTIVHEPEYETYSVYETWSADDTVLPLRITGYKTEKEARTFCETRQKHRVVAEYPLDG